MLSAPGYSPGSRHCGESAHSPPDTGAHCWSGSRSRSTSPATHALHGCACYVSKMNTLRAVGWFVAVGHHSACTAHAQGLPLLLAGASIAAGLLQSLPLSTVGNSRRCSTPALTFRMLPSLSMNTGQSPSSSSTLLTSIPTKSPSSVGSCWSSSTVLS